MKTVFLISYAPPGRTKRGVTENVSPVMRPKIRTYSPVLIYPATHTYQLKVPAEEQGARMFLSIWRSRLNLQYCRGDFSLLCQT